MWGATRCMRTTGWSRNRLENQMRMIWGLLLVHSVGATCIIYQCTCNIKNRWISRGMQIRPGASGHALRQQGSRLLLLLLLLLLIAVVAAMEDDLIVFD